MFTNAILEQMRGTGSFRRLLGSGRRDLIKDICANLGRVSIPFGLPVTVNLPVRTSTAMLASVAPVPNGRVRRAQATV